MAAFITSKVGKILAEKAFEDIKSNKTLNINSKNPFFEEAETVDHKGRRKLEKRKRIVPEGLSAHDAKVLKKVRSRAYHLDMSLFNCCGIRFGWSSLVGIIPVIGDFIDVFLALMVVRMAQKVDGGLPQQLRARMVFNILLDFAVGLVPILGDLADAVFRANTRNAWLLETYLTKKRDAQLAGVVKDPETGERVAVKALPPGTAMAKQTTDAWHGSSTPPTGPGARTGNGRTGGTVSGSNGGGRSGWRDFFRSENTSSTMQDEEMAVSAPKNGYGGARNNMSQNVSHPAQQSGISRR